MHRVIISLSLCIFPLLMLASCPSAGGGSSDPGWNFVLSTAAGTFIAGSDDGDAWTAATYPVSTSSVSQICEGNNRHWIAIDATGILLSDDSRNWAACTTMPTGTYTYISGVAFDGSSRWGVCRR